MEVTMAWTSILFISLFQVKKMVACKLCSLYRIPFIYQYLPSSNSHLSIPPPLQYMYKIILLCILLVAVSTSQQQYRRAIRNILKPNQPIEINCIIRYQNTILKQHTLQLLYNHTENVEIPIDLDLSFSLQQNLTVEVSLYRFGAANSKILISNAKRNLTRYQRVRTEGRDMLASTYDPMDQVESLSQARKAKEGQTETKYDMHIPKDFHIMWVFTEYMFPEGQLQKQHRLELIREQGSLYYLPAVDLGQLYIPTTKSVPLNEGNNSLKLTFFTIGYEKYLFFYSIAHPEQFAKDLGPMAEYLNIKEDAMDELKEMMFDNPPWLIALYFILSLAETILKFATIKSEFKFWKDIDKNKGVSLKTLFFQLSAEIIMLLYLYEYDAGKLILFFHVLDIAVTLWKITRTYTLGLISSFPFIQIRTSELYRKREQLDGNAIWYMNYLLVPLMVIYLGYALHKRNWRVVEYYKFGLQTAVAFIAIFGFILMTPQLYINYKLKSVEHLNWRGLVYRFVTTIIDDVFAFMITMPTLRRVMYFRDDIIFLVYLYQRYIYKVDYQRKTMFTMDQANNGNQNKTIVVGQQPEGNKKQD